MAECEELKSLLVKVKEENQKASLKLNSKNEDSGIQSPHFLANRWGNNGYTDRLYFLWAPKSLWTVTAAMKLKDTCSLEGSYDKPRQHFKKQRHHFNDKGLSS